MKYPPRKVFVLEDGMYVELSYAQFSQKKECYASRRFIPLHGMLMEVSESDYKAFYKDKRRQKYLDERSAKNGDFSYDMLTTDEFNGEDILVDMASDTAGDVEKEIMLDNLRLEVKRLSEDEQKLYISSMVNGLANGLSRSVFMCPRTPSTGVKPKSYQSYGKQKI